MPQRQAPKSPVVVLTSVSAWAAATDSGSCTGSRDRKRNTGRPWFAASGRAEDRQKRGKERYNARMMVVPVPPRLLIFCAPGARGGLGRGAAERIARSQSAASSAL